jgi:hypothetical protein
VTCASDALVTARVGSLRGPSWRRWTEEEATAIRAAIEQCGELSAAIELRRLFPGITDNAQARECARTIAGWKPSSSANRNGGF